MDLLSKLIDYVPRALEFSRREGIEIAPGEVIDKVRELLPPGFLDQIKSLKDQFSDPLEKGVIDEMITDFGKAFVDHAIVMILLDQNIARLEEVATDQGENLLLRRSLEKMRSIVQFLKADLQQQWVIWRSTYFSGS